jgi:hypothetical protein
LARIKCLVHRGIAGLFRAAEAQTMTGEVGPRQTFEMEQDRFVPADDVKVAGDQTSHGEVECAAEDGWGDAQGHGVGIW